MKLYIASAFNLVPDVEAVVRWLEADGHSITVKWWSKDGFDLRDKKADNDNPDAFYQDPVCELIFKRDFGGILEADAFVLIAGAAPRAFNGANVEYGIALAHGKPCFSIGKLDNSALYFPIVKCASLSELLERLREVRS